LVPPRAQGSIRRCPPASRAAPAARSPTVVPPRETRSAASPALRATRAEQTCQRPSICPNLTTIKSAIIPGVRARQTKSARSTLFTGRFDFVSTDNFGRNAVWLSSSTASAAEIAAPFDLLEADEDGPPSPRPHARKTYSPVRQAEGSRRFFRPFFPSRAGRSRPSSSRNLAPVSTRERSWEDPSRPALEGFPQRAYGPSNGLKPSSAFESFAPAAVIMGYGKLVRSVKTATRPRFARVPRPKRLTPRSISTAPSAIPSPRTFAAPLRP